MDGRELGALQRHQVDTLSPVFCAALEAALLSAYRERRGEVERLQEEVRANAGMLTAQKQQALQALILAQSAVVRDELERTVEELDTQIRLVGEHGIETDLTEDNIRQFVQFARETIEPPRKPLLDSENSHRVRTVLGLIFDEMPTYDEVVNRTAKLCFVFALSERFDPTKSVVVGRVGFEPTKAGGRVIYSHEHLTALQSAHNYFINC